MGACSSAPSEIELSSFRVGKPIGKGGFGKVYVTLTNDEWSKAKKHVGSFSKPPEEREKLPPLPNLKYLAIKCISKARLLGLDRPQRTSVSAASTHHSHGLHNTHLASPDDGNGPQSSHGAEADRASAMMIWAERTIMASLRNPYLVKLLHAFQSDDELYLVMPFYVGGDVHTFLNKHTRMSEDVARVYAAEVVIALEHIHSQFYVYRDLKPLNLLFDEEGHIAVTDYGLCRLLEEDQDYKIVGRGGTRGYRAPEVANGLAYDFSCDLFSFGVTLYEMCTGRRKPQSLHPGTAQTVNDVKVNSRLSNELKDLVRRLTMPNVYERLGCELSCKRITERCKRLGVPINDFYAKKSPSSTPPSNAGAAAASPTSPVTDFSVACPPSELSSVAGSPPGASSDYAGHSRTQSQPNTRTSVLGSMPLPTSSRGVGAGAQYTRGSGYYAGITGNNSSTVDPRSVEISMSGASYGSNGRRNSLTATASPSYPNGNPYAPIGPGRTVPATPGTGVSGYASPADDDDDEAPHPRAREKNAGQEQASETPIDGWHNRTLEQIDEDNNFLWNAIKNHPWFRGVDWERVARREIQPGYAPKFDRRELLDALFGAESGAPIIPNTKKKGGKSAAKPNSVNGSPNLMLSGGDEHRALPRLSPRQQELFVDFEFNIDPNNPVDLSQPAKLSERELAFLSRKNRRRDSASSVVYSRESSRMVSISSPAVSGHRSTSMSTSAVVPSVTATTGQGNGSGVASPEPSVSNPPNSRSRGPSGPVSMSATAPAGDARKAGAAAGGPGRSNAGTTISFVANKPRAGVSLAPTGAYSTSTSPHSPTSPYDQHQAQQAQSRHSQYFAQSHHAQQQQQQQPPQHHRSVSMTSRTQYDGQVHGQSGIRRNYSVQQPEAPQASYGTYYGRGQR